MRWIMFSTSIDMRVNEHDLAHLAALSQRGDRAAYSAFLETVRVWLQRYYGRKIGPDFMDDVIQETLMSIHSKLATYDPDRPILPWLAAIARYRWVDHLRRLYQSRAKLAASPHDEDAAFAISGIESETVARLSLERLLAHLPEGQTRAIEMVKIEGHSVAEAASLSGQSESLIKVNIHRGLKTLAKLIEKA